MSNFKPSIFNGISKSIEYVAQLDGATQYWLLESPIEIIIGDEILHEFRKNDTSNNTRQSLTGLTDNFTALVLLNNDGTYLPSRGDFFVDNQPVGSVDSYPTDTLFHETRLVSNVGFLLETLGANWTTRNEGVTRHFDGVISSFKVKRNGVVIHEIPLKNKAQGATQLATVGSVNAFMPNYTESVWKDKSKL